MKESEFDSMIYAIAAGLYEKSQRPEKYFYSEKLMYGINKLAAMAAQNGRADILSELHENAFLKRFAARPVRSWFVRWDTAFTAELKKYPLFNTGALAEIYDGNVFDITDECAVLCATTESDFFNALTQENAYRKMRELSAEEYTAVREFIVLHPLCSERDIRRFKIAHNSPEIQSVFNAAYEDIPQDSYKCPECGWTMRFIGKRSVCCNNSCSRTHRTRDQFERIDSSYEKRHVHGVICYMCIPGKIEIKIRNEAEKLGCETELWPEHDKYDIKIILPDGSVWAIDAKTHLNPYNLASQIKNDGSFTSEQADEHIYVVPHERKAENPAYCDICKDALQPGALFMTDKELYRKIKEAI